MIIFKMFLLMCVLFTVEVFATAIVGFFDKSKLPDERKRGVGFSYIWMAGVYGTFPILFEVFGWLISGLTWYWIILINYVFGVVVITAIETGWGYLLTKGIGFCPWSTYTKEQRGILLGYSRWDWSLCYGLAAVVFFYFMKFFEYSMRWM